MPSHDFWSHSKDFNGDTHLDLAVATTSGTVSILLGTGTGTFNAAVQYAVVGIAPMSVASDDFNGDTHADLAVVTRYSVDILLGTGTGVFVAAGQYQAGKSPTSVIASDFNDDQKIDLVLVNQGSNSITVLLNTFLAT